MDFALILFVLSMITGALWALDRLYMRRRREKDVPEPIWVEWGASFFPILIAIFLLRAFLVEPFRIPSGSMLPTLEAGDFILVNKYVYGIRLPVIDKKIIDIGTPKRGDVVVFRYPIDPSVDYIKRVVGLPGDKLEYINKRLRINGQDMPVQPSGSYLLTEEKGGEAETKQADRLMEKLGDVQHDILNKSISDAPAFVKDDAIRDYPWRKNCVYTLEGFRCTVPPGHYFMMGDNRDGSSDSRYWGFVPDANLRGRAFFIWFSLSDLRRVGGFH